MIHKVGEPVVIVILRQIEDRRQFNKKEKPHKKEQRTRRRRATGLLFIYVFGPIWYHNFKTYIHDFRLMYNTVIKMKQVHLRKSK